MLRKAWRLPLSHHHLSHHLLRVSPPGGACCPLRRAHVKSSGVKSLVGPDARDMQRGGKGNEAEMRLQSGQLHQGHHSPPCGNGKRVVVIGAGAGGLVAARELRREGHQVTVLEQGPGIGGVWRYTEAVEEEDLLGSKAERGRVHGSMYRGLRTNLPREIMGYSDFPFVPAMMGGRSVDPRRFPTHVEVLRYLECFADHYRLHDLIRLNRQVIRVASLSFQLDTTGTAAALSSSVSPGKLMPSGARRQGWRVTVRSSATSAEEGPPSTGRVEEVEDGTEEVLNCDAVVIANGHFSEPRLPQPLPSEGAAFPGRQIHSHNYRSPEGFQDQVVLVVGAANSGEDISREAADVAKMVYVSARDASSGASSNSRNGGDAETSISAPYGPQKNIRRCPLVSRLTSDGLAILQDGQTIGPIDVVIYCTGYLYSFPFLDVGKEAAASGSLPSSSYSGVDEASPPPVAPAADGPIITVRDQRVEPLFMDLFPPRLAPSLAFLGLPWKVVPFPQMELQARLVARALSGRVTLPPPDEMARGVEERYASQEREGVPRRYTHMQGGGYQWKYNDQLAELMSGTGSPDHEVATPPWRVRFYEESREIKGRLPDGYRDGPFLQDSSEDRGLAERVSEELDTLAHRILSQQKC